MAGIVNGGLATSLAAGSTTVTATSGSVTGSTILAVTTSFTPTGSLTTERGYHTATMLNNGTVLIAGGGGAFSDLTGAETYDSTTGTFAPTGSMAAARQFHRQLC